MSLREFLISLALILIVHKDATFNAARPIADSGDMPDFASDSDPEGVKLDMKTKVEQCAAKAQISDATKENLAIGKYLDVDMTEKCFLKCYLEMSGLLEDGKFKPDVLLKHLLSKVTQAFNKLREKCSKIREEDSCDAGYEMFVCYAELKNFTNIKELNMNFNK